MNIKLLFFGLLFYGCGVQASGVNPEIAEYLQKAKREQLEGARDKNTKKAEAGAKHRQALAQIKAQQAKEQAEKEARLPQAKQDLNDKIFALARHLQDEIGKGNGRMRIYKDTSYKAYDILRKNEFAQDERIGDNLGGSYPARRSWLFIPKDEKLEKMCKLKTQLDDILIELNPIDDNQHEE